MRPCVSVTGTRCTRCTPASHLHNYGKDGLATAEYQVQSLGCDGRMQVQESLNIKGGAHRT